MSAPVTNTQQLHVKQTLIAFYNCGVTAEPHTESSFGQKGKMGHTKSPSCHVIKAVTQGDILAPGSFSELLLWKTNQQTTLLHRPEKTRSRSKRHYKLT